MSASSEGVLRRSVFISGGCVERASCSLDHVFGLVVTEVVLAPESAGGVRDLGQARVRLRSYGLTTPFRPVDPLLRAHGAFR